MKGLISIIVPIYNTEEYLYECVDSLVNQTYKNIEIILVDDGSIDSSAKICDEYSQKDNRIKVIHKQNGGLSSARNAGLEIAQGEFIGFIDSDDYINHDMYERLIEEFTDDIDIVSCGIRTFDNETKNEIDCNDEKIHETYYIDKREYLNYFENGITVLPKLNVTCKLFRKSLIENTHFPLGKNSEDFYFMYLLYPSILANNSTIKIIPFYPYNYRIHDNSICTSQDKPLQVDTLTNILEISQDVKKYDLTISNKLYYKFTSFTLNWFNLIINDSGLYKSYFNKYRHLLRMLSYNDIFKVYQNNNRFKIFTYYYIMKHCSYLLHYYLIKLK